MNFGPDYSTSAHTRDWKDVVSQAYVLSGGRDGQSSGFAILGAVIFSYRRL